MLVSVLNRLRSPLAALALLACAETASVTSSSDAPVDPMLSGGKSDAADRVVHQGALPLGSAARTGAFAEDLEFHGFELAVRKGARLALEVTQKGSSKGLDTTLYVYGPKSESGYGTKSVAFDDDSGYGKLSKLKEIELDGGSWLVVVGTRDGRGRGNYRLQATCNSGDCAPIETNVGSCPAPLRSAIDACVSGWLADADYDPSTQPHDELIAACADAEVVAPAYDATCGASGVPADFCAMDLETLSAAVLPGCRDEITNLWRDGACVFGSRYRELFDAPDALIVVTREVLTSPDGIGGVAADQIIRAVKETAHDDVTSVERAFEVVDEGIVNRTTLWDASNRVAYTAIEVGAGDNSFGAIFRWGTTDVATRINDGDYDDCTVTWGPEQRRCTSDAGCPSPTRCQGYSDASPLGRCRTPAADVHPADGAECSTDAACPIDGGLLCQGASVGGSGLCGFAWTRGRFISRPGLPIPDGNAGGTTAQVLVYGLATVSTDVRADLLVSHPRTTDLLITLTNPAGTEVVVADGLATTNGELWLDGVALSGFPGDESANGVWTFRAVDRKSGKAGTLQAVALEVTSRWD